MPMLLQDKILIVLHGGGPRTNSEIAEILGTKLLSTRTSNTLNIQMDRVTYIRASNGEARMSITSHGIERLKKVRSTYEAPPKACPVRDNILLHLKKGLWAKDWKKVTNSRATLYKWIIALKHEGYVIRKKKDGAAVFYKVIKEPVG
jgi:hypothetical protein